MTRRLTVDVDWITFYGTRIHWFCDPFWWNCMWWCKKRGRKNWAKWTWIEEKVTRTLQGKSKIQRRQKRIIDKTREEKKRSSWAKRKKKENESSTMKKGKDGEQSKRWKFLDFIARIKLVPYFQTSSKTIFKSCTFFFRSSSSWNSSFWLMNIGYKNYILSNALWVPFPSSLPCSAFFLVPQLLFPFHIQYITSSSSTHLPSKSKFLR